MAIMDCGDDSSGGGRMRRPEVRYMAQRFTLHGRARHEIDTCCAAFLERQLPTGTRNRDEPITRWFMIENSTTYSGSTLAWRLSDDCAGLDCTMLQGLLFGALSIEGDAGAAYGVHDRIDSMLLRRIPVDSQTELRRLCDKGVRP